MVPLRILNMILFVFNIYNFLLVFCWDKHSISHHSRDILYLRVLNMKLTARVYQRSNILSFPKAIYNFILVFCSNEHSISHRSRDIDFTPFSRYSISESSVYETDCSCSPKIKYFIFTKAKYNFILVFCSHEHSISHRSPDILYLRVLNMTL